MLTDAASFNQASTMSRISQPDSSVARDLVEPSIIQLASELGSRRPPPHPRGAPAQKADAIYPSTAGSTTASRQFVIRSPPAQSRRQKSPARTEILGE